MSEYLPYLPYALYACPFVVAAIVLVKAKVAGPRAEVAEDGDVEVMTPQDQLVHEVRSRPIHRQYVSYGM